AGVIVAGLAVFGSSLAGRAQTNGPGGGPVLGAPAPPGAAQPGTPTPPPTTPPPPLPAPAPTPAAPAQPRPPRPPSPSSQRKLQLSVKDGLVTLVAQNVTVRDIMSEWQRRTGCQFVNAEKLTSGPLTLDFPGRPELEVIGALLRDSAGTTAGSGYGYI